MIIFVSAIAKPTLLVMNTLAYIVYLFITCLITVRTGWLFYRNGRVYIVSLLKGDEQLAHFINRLLLTGYYLINLGYAAVMISSWQTVTDITVLLTSIAAMTGKIMLTLALIHFCNMGIIYIISRRNKYFIKPINHQS
jgi:ABC-type Co2+ transport system permease subunit